MPLTAFQKRVLALLTGHRSERSEGSHHLAGATALGLSPESRRFSHGLDYLHDSEVSVAETFDLDKWELEDSGFQVKLLLSQPGFIRALVANSEGEVRVDWGHDSSRRFMPPVEIHGVGFVLHPVDLAIRKVLALAGRDDPRDLIDTLFVNENILPLGALVWAASGKNPGMSPVMMIEFLQRRGKPRKEDLRYLDMETPPDLKELRATWRDALAEARAFVDSRPSEEAGCLYVDVNSGRFVAPEPGQALELHYATEGGVLPAVEGFGADRPDDLTKRFFALEPTSKVGTPTEKGK